MDMKRKNAKITYDKDLDFLDITVDPNSSSNIFISKPMDGLSLKFNGDTGGLLEIMLHDIKKNIKERKSGFIWDEEDDSLSIPLTSEGGPNSLCDLVYNDMRDHSLVTLDRNAVGNLVGIQIVNIYKLFEKSSS